MRAELTGIHAALEQSTAYNPSNSVTIFTDSLISLYDIQRALRRLQTLIKNKHFPLLCSILESVLKRMAAQGPTAFRKVRAHIGVIVYS